MLVVVGRFSAALDDRVSWRVFARVFIPDHRGVRLGDPVAWVSGPGFLAARKSLPAAWRLGEAVFSGGFETWRALRPSPPGNESPLISNFGIIRALSYLPVAVGPGGEPRRKSVNAMGQLGPGAFGLESE